MPKRYFTPKLIKLGLVLAVCSLLIFFNPREIFNPIRGLFWRAAYPFQKIFYFSSQRVADKIELLKSISQLKNNNENLLKENNLLISEIASLKEAKSENENLRAQLDLFQKKEFNLEAAFVIGQSPGGADDWLMIDKGKNQGIGSGMPVIVSGNILVGKVSEVFAESAKIDLLTNPESSINAIDLETGSRGVVRGEFSLGLLLEAVAQEDTLNNGDMVVTSGLGSSIPKSLLIGKIQELRITRDKLFQQALVIPRVKYSKLAIVFVIKN